MAKSARASARSSARASARKESAAPSKASARDDDKKKKGRRPAGGGGTELAICAGVIVVLVAVCVGVYIIKNKERQEAERQFREQNRATEENTERGWAAFQKAEQAGHNFVTGKTPDVKTEELMSAFSGDDKIVNVVFNRLYKDKKKKDQTDQRALAGSDLHAVGIGKSLGTKHDVQLNMGEYGGRKIVIARKTFPPDENDKSNRGGEIIVMVAASSGSE